MSRWPLCPLLLASTLSMFIASYVAVQLSSMSVTIYCTWAKPSSIYFVCVWAKQLMAIQCRSEPRSTMTCKVSIQFPFERAEASFPQISTNSCHSQVAQVAQTLRFAEFVSTPTTPMTTTLTEQTSLPFAQSCGVMIVRYTYVDGKHGLLIHHQSAVSSACKTCFANQHSSMLHTSLVSCDQYCRLQEKTIYKLCLLKSWLQPHDGHPLFAPVCVCLHACFAAIGLRLQNKCKSHGHLY